MVDLKFSLKSCHCHVLELKWKLSFVQLTWKIGNSADLNKLKKYIVANFAINATKLFKSTHGLLKSTAADLDMSFKRENLQLVSQNSAKKYTQRKMKNAQGC